MTRFAFALFAIPALSACAAAGVMDETDPVADCEAAPAMHLIGERVSDELGVRLLELTGASILRMAPPGSVLTMDFRTDRVTVSYNDEMIIEEITCG